MGGRFRICVSGDGSYTTGNVDVWPVEAEIYGGWVGIGENQYKGSWGPAFDSASPTAAQLCGQSAYATQICLNGADCQSAVESGAGTRMKLAAPRIQGTGRYHLPSAKNTLSGSGTDGSGFVPFSTAACWCPSASCIASTASAYSQMIGTVHFYTSKTCRSDDKQCQSDFIGVVPQKHFKVRVNCPLGACADAMHNRFKIIARSPTAGADYDN
eukprot:g17530.t1